MQRMQNFNNILPKVFFDGKDNLSFYNFSESFHAASILASSYLGSSYLYATILDETDGYLIQFRSLKSNHCINIHLGDLITVYDNEVQISYKCEFRDKLETRIDQVCHSMADKTILLKEDGHRYIVKVIFGDRVLEINLDLVPTCFDEESFFKGLTEASDINDLRKFYLSRYYPCQSEYGQGEENIVCISSLENPELVEELVVRNGLISRYLLTKEIKGMLIKAEGIDLNNPTITITNYQVMSDLKAIDELVLKVQALKKSEDIKAIHR